eukprot:10115262-Ditylum_brightwellii.AAC.1
MGKVVGEVWEEKWCERQSEHGKCRQLTEMAEFCPVEPERWLHRAADNPNTPKAQCLCVFTLAGVVAGDKTAVFDTVTIVAITQKNLLCVVGPK